MRRHWYTSAALFCVIITGGWFVWKTGIASKIYSRVIPIGEIWSARVKGINHKKLKNTNQEGFEFLVIGHAYGGQDKDDHLPANYLRSTTSSLNELNPAFLVSLGDMVQYSEKEDFDILDQTLLNLLDFPVLNTVGNHDIENRDLYEARFGQTYYTFNYGPTRLIFLDTEKVECDLDLIQKRMLLKAIDKAIKNNKTRYIFIFMHKTLFFRDATLGDIRNPQASPNQWTCYDKRNLWKFFDEVIVPTAALKPIYVFAGDVGAWGNLTPYYEQHPDFPLTLVMTGLGDTSMDNIIHVRVDKIQVEVGVILLHDFSHQPITHFNSDFWVQVAKGEIQLWP